VEGEFWGDGDRGETWLLDDLENSGQVGRRVGGVSEGDDRFVPMN
jgi:hypothetical protein